jgi:hypothetical protein
LYGPGPILQQSRVNSSPPQSRSNEIDSSTDGNCELVTIIECGNAAGENLRPSYIFKGKSVQEQWVRDDAIRDPRPNYTYSDSDWTDNVIGVNWIEKVFDPATQHLLADGGWCLLILDGHASHVSFEFVKYAWDHHINILCLPSHASADLQPLDVAVFSPLATRWAQEVTRFGSMLAISKRDFCG